MAATKPTTPESAVLSGCLKLLALRQVPAWRNNVGGFKVGNRFVRAGTKGSSDILAVVPFPGPHRGRLLCVECKRRGGKPTAEQSAFLDRVRVAGGIGLVIDDVGELADALDRLEQGSEL